MTKIVISQAQLRYVPPGELIADPQVRVDQDSYAAEQAFLNSIGTFGVMQPIAVRQVRGKLHIVHGHRRARAARLLKLPSVPVLVQAITDDEITARQLVENLQRSDLTLRDQAAGVRKLYEEHGVAGLVAEMLGKSRPWVSKMLTLTAPGKSTLAQRLIADDYLQDLELAYLLCALEELDYDAARSFYWRMNMQHPSHPVSRDELRKNIDQVRQAKAKPLPTPKAEDETDDEAAAAEGPPVSDDVSMTLTRAEWETLRSVMLEAELDDAAQELYRRLFG